MKANLQAPYDSLLLSIFVQIVGGVTELIGCFRGAIDQLKFAHDKDNWAQGRMPPRSAL